MMLKEWLDKRIKDAREDCLNQDIETYEDGYAEGYKDALQLVRDKLPFLDHDVTLKEFTAYCSKFNISRDQKFYRSCDQCGLWDRGECPYQNNLSPDEWHTEEIEKAIKEKKHE